MSSHDRSSSVPLEGHQCLAFRRYSKDITTSWKCDDEKPRGQNKGTGWMSGSTLLIYLRMIDRLVLRSVYTSTGCMMTSSNGNIFRVTGPLCRNSSVTGEFPPQRPVTRSFDIFFNLCMKKLWSKQSWDWWFETPSRSLWRHCDVFILLKHGDDVK